MRLHARQVPEKEVRSREKALMLFGAIVLSGSIVFSVFKLNVPNWFHDNF